MERNLGWPPRSQLMTVISAFVPCFHTRWCCHNPRGIFHKHKYCAPDLDRRLECNAYHLRVTCPFWTRFILKPTVGMELMSNIESAAAMHQRWPLPVYNLTTTPRNIGLELGHSILNGELSTLRRTVVSLSAKDRCGTHRGRWINSPPAPGVATFSQRSANRSW